MEDHKKGNKLLENFMWSGVVSFVFIFIFELEWVKAKAGSYIVLYQNCDYTVCIACFIMGGRRTLDLFNRVFKALGAIKHGEEDEK